MFIVSSVVTIVSYSGDRTKPPDRVTAIQPDSAAEIEVISH